MNDDEGPNSLDARLRKLTDETLPDIGKRTDAAIVELQNDRSERREWLRIVAVLLAVQMLMGLGTAYGVWNIISGRSTSRATQRAILDCTTPAGACARQEELRNAANVTEIVRRVALVVGCSYRPEAEFQACTDQALADMPDLPTN